MTGLNGSLMGSNGIDLVIGTLTGLKGHWNFKEVYGSLTGSSVIERVMKTLTGSTGHSSKHRETRRQHAAVDASDIGHDVYLPSKKVAILQ